MPGTAVAPGAISSKSIALFLRLIVTVAGLSFGRIFYLCVKVFLTALFSGFGFAFAIAA